MSSSKYVECVNTTAYFLIQMVTDTHYFTQATDLIQKVSINLNMNHEVCPDMDLHQDSDVPHIRTIALSTETKVVLKLLYLSLKWPMYLVERDQCNRQTYSTMPNYTWGHMKIIGKLYLWYSLAYKNHSQTIP